MKSITVYLDDEDYEFIMELCRRVGFYNKSKVLRLLIGGLRVKYSIDDIVKIILEGLEEHTIKRIYDLCTGLTATQIANKLGLSKVTVYQYLEELVKRGLVVKRGVRYYKTELIKEYYKTRIQEEIEWWKKEIELAQKLKDRLPKK